MTAARAMGAVMIAALAAGRSAQAHELRPALLSLTETAPGEYAVDFRLPLETALGQTPTPIFPDGAEPIDRTRTRVGDVISERFRVRVADGLAGRHLRVRFSGATGSEVLVRITARDGRTITGRLVPRQGNLEADWVVPSQPSTLAVAAAYLRLGIEHILTGFDHLAFVLGLVLLTPAWRQLWKTVTAFTVAHSLTLALAALGLVRVPPAPVE